MTGEAMSFDDMLVETPVRLDRLDDRTLKSGHERESQCSTCGTDDFDPWYPIEDVMVVRHWTKHSVDEPFGGKWWWYCPTHFEQWGGKWWPNSDLAPSRLLPEVVHTCERPGPLGSTCGEKSSVAIGGVWTCERHAEAARVQRRIDELFADGDTML